MTMTAFLAALSLAALPALPALPGSDRPVLPVQDSAPDLAATEWEVYEIGGRLLAIDPLPRISFLEDDRFAASAGCNRFSGGYDQRGSALAFPQAIAGTRMACQPPLDRLENDMMARLIEAVAVVSAGDQIALTNAAGVTVLRLRPAG